MLDDEENFDQGNIFPEKIRLDKIYTNLGTALVMETTPSQDNITLMHDILRSSLELEEGRGEYIL